MRIRASFAAAALAVGLMAAQTANAGIIIIATANGNAIPGLNGVSVLPGVDPVTQNAPPRQIFTGPAPSPFVVGNSVLSFGSFNASQRYDPPSGGAPADILSAIGNSSAIGITNTAVNGAGTDITLVLTLVFDGFNYPVDNPMNWTSTISSTRLDGRATLMATASVTDNDPNTPNYSANHSVLTGANIQNNTASQNIAALIEPGRPFSVTQTLTVFLPGDSGINFGKVDTLTAVDRVPEPTTLALLGASLLGLGVSRRYRRRTH
jgi:hypothetical protein